jgi:hypothetical protein
MIMSAPLSGLPSSEATLSHLSTSSRLLPDWFTSIERLLDAFIGIHDTIYCLFSDFVNECLRDLFAVQPHYRRLLQVVIQHDHRILQGSYIKKAIVKHAIELKSKTTSDFLEALLIDDIKISEAEWINYEAEEKRLEEEATFNNIILPRNSLFSHS